VGEQHQLHLNLNLLNSGVYGGAWRHAASDPHAFADVDFYVHYARLCERAKLDAVFLADGAVLTPDSRFRPFPSLEPTVVLATIAAVTERIGLIGTASTSYNDPYNLARRLLTLDRVSGGRLGWNVVTTAGSLAAQNFGLDAAPPHAARYERAAEFVDVTLKLWRSFPGEAVVGDRQTGEFLDLDRVPPIDHLGEHFQVRGPLNVPGSAQGYPVLVQAGASQDGKRFAARYAEAIFTVAKSLADGQAFYAEIKDLARAAGRNPDHVVVLPGLSTVIGATEAQALERRAHMEDLVHPEYALGRLAELLGVPGDELVLEEPLPDSIVTPPAELESSQGFRASTIAFSRREGLTVRQLLRRLGGSNGHRIVAGTPEQVADDIELWFRSGAADGFNVMPDAIQGGTEAFLEHVVPELQRRGLFRTEYTGTTLRDHLGLPVPSVASVPSVPSVQRGHGQLAHAGAARP
jgi:FMN-dependent oxidoreductase (nitrilotriacetate monooxygenase family)